MTKEQAIEWLKSLNYCDGEETQEVAQAIDMAIKALEQQPSEDCVSLEVYKQVVWERDIAIEQLKELGYSFGEKISTSDDCVSRQAVIDMTGLSNWFDSSDDYNSFVEDLCKLPPVTPTQCIAAVRFSKDDLREICNERIEIECTHGTCKDCFYYNIDEDGHGYHCEKYGHTRFPVYADFYCKDFEKKGGSDGSN